jgi:hypothetical protein
MEETKTGILHFVQDDDIREWVSNFGKGEGS